MSARSKLVAIVTGASSGIGQNIAIELSGRGYAVVLCGRNKDGLEATSKLCQENGAAVADVQGDLSDPSEPERIVSATAEKFEKINALINNAGFGNMPDSFETLTAESFDSVYYVNIRAPVLLTKASVPYLQKTKGTVINISSMITAKPIMGMVAYGMTKAAMDFFTRSAACAYGDKGIRVCGILPGYIPTPAHEKATEALPEHVKASIQQQVIDSQLLKHMGKSEDVSKAVAFLLSEDASFITGDNIVIDGGLHLGKTNSAGGAQNHGGRDKY